MSNLLNVLLITALGVNLSPTAVTAVILSLLSPRAWGNGVAFLLGWTLSLIGAYIIAVSIGDSLTVSIAPTQHTASALVNMAKLLLGVMFLFLALRRFLRRKEVEKEARPETPKWMKAIESTTPVRSFIIAVIMIVLSPVNLGCVLVAGIAVGHAGLPTNEIWLIMIVFIVIASLSVMLPVAYYFLKPDSASNGLERLKNWLTSNDSTILTAMLLVVGAALVVNGLADLLT